MTLKLRDRIQRCKAEVDFPALVAETHAMTGRRILCPFHGDRTPSCVIYSDGFFCFTCGAQGDHLDWLESLGYTKEEARTDLTRRANGFSGDVAPSAPAPRVIPEAKPIPHTALAYLERRQQALDRVPASLSEHGFSAADLQQLGVAARGEDAVIPIYNPSSDVVNLKARLHNPRQGGYRYTYMLRGYGNPAWCAPGFSGRRRLLVIEGELNAAQFYLALTLLGVQADVVGSAGAHGPIYPGIFAGRDLFLYTDPDKAGDDAKDSWRAQAITERARSVTALPPLPAGDACELVNHKSRAALAHWLYCYL